MELYLTKWYPMCFITLKHFVLIITLWNNLSFLIKCISKICKPDAKITEESFQVTNVINIVVRLLSQAPSWAHLWTLFLVMDSLMSWGLRRTLLFFRIQSFSLALSAPTLSNAAIYVPWLCLDMPHISPAAKRIYNWQLSAKSSLASYCLQLKELPRAMSISSDRSCDHTGMAEGSSQL